MNRILVHACEAKLLITYDQSPLSLKKKTRDDASLGERVLRAVDGV